MKISAVIIEDEKLARATIHSYLEEYFPNVTVVSEVDNVNEAIEILNNQSPQILFLDIELRDGLGIDVLNKADFNTDTKIIFTTAHDNFTLEAFKFKAFGYLLKPLSPMDFKEIMNRAIKDILFTDQSAAKLKVPLKSGYKMISIFDIVRCQADVNYTKVVTKQGDSYILSKTLKVVEEELLNSSYFIRTHHAHLINLHYVDIEGVKGEKIVLNNEDVIPISRSKKRNLIEHINAFASDSH